MKVCENFLIGGSNLCIAGFLWPSWLPSNITKSCDKKVPVKFQNEAWGRGTALKAPGLTTLSSLPTLTVQAFHLSALMPPVWLHWKVVSPPSSLQPLSILILSPSARAQGPAQRRHAINIGC